MMRSQRIKIIEGLANKKQQAAANKMQTAKNDWDVHREQLESLYRYRLEYQQKLINQTGVLISIQYIKEYTLFIAKITQAINLQQNTVTQFENTFKQRQILWIQEKRKVNALSKVVVSLEEEELQIEEVKEQKMMDEHATNAYYQKHH
jgi:flagellar FliJ protein